MSAVAERRPVPCAGCTACCQGTAVRLHPEHGDDADKYQTDLYDDGRPMLAHAENGDCFYLDRATGCTIHERAPWTCRQFDCRSLLVLPRRTRRALVRSGDVRRRVIEAAARLPQVRP